MFIIGKSEKEMEKEREDHYIRMDDFTLDLYQLFYGDKLSYKLSVCLVNVISSFQLLLGCCQRAHNEALFGDNQTGIFYLYVQCGVCIYKT